MEGLEVSPAFWLEKKVFLTGHTGFKGGWLSVWLKSLGANVTGYALAPPTAPCFYETVNVGDGMKSITGDVRDLPALQDAMKRAQPEIVIHMAAQSLVRESYAQPVDTYAVNVMGTVNVLEAVRQTPGVRAVVNVTTDKCYENQEWIWGYRESEPMGGYDPYSSSKACAELASAAYRTSFFNPLSYAQHGVALATARAGNVIGGGDWAKDRLIPDMLKAFLAGTPATIRNPAAIRPWQHVLEPLRGYLTLAECLYEKGPAFAEAWNFGPNDADARSVGWVANQLALKWGACASWRAGSSQQPHEAGHLKLDISKAKARLNWQPAIRLETALDLIIAWHQSREATSSAHDVTLRQIQTYQKLASLMS